MFRALSLVSLSHRFSPLNSQNFLPGMQGACRDYLDLAMTVLRGKGQNCSLTLNSAEVRGATQVPRILAMTSGVISFLALSCLRSPQDVPYCMVLCDLLSLGPSLSCLWRVISQGP